MSTLVSDLFNLFLELRDIGDGTRQLYAAALDRWIEYAGDSAAADVTPMDAAVFVKRLGERRVRGKVISPTTVNMAVRAMKAFFNWLVETEVIAKSPMSKVRYSRAVRAGKDLYENDEAAALLAAAPNDRWRLMIALAVCGGLRRGEILNLTVSEVDYLAGVIRLIPKEQTDQTWAWSIKDHESRLVPITVMMEKLLLRVHAGLPDSQPYLCIAPGRYRYLRERLNDGRLTYEHRRVPENNFNRTFSMICTAAGVPNKTFHALRGSAFTIMAENGLQPHEIQRLAGHSSVETTYRHYVRPRHQFIARARDAAWQ